MIRATRHPSFVTTRYDHIVSWPVMIGLVLAYSDLGPGSKMSPSSSKYDDSDGCETYGTVCSRVRWLGTADHS